MIRLDFRLAQSEKTLDTCAFEQNNIMRITKALVSLDQLTLFLSFSSVSEQATMSEGNQPT